MLNSPHVVIDMNSLTRWYDNPDISDIMFAMFEDKFASINSLCLHTYDRVSKKGLSGFSLKGGKWSASKLIESLEGMVVYHPILTVSTTDKNTIAGKFDSILNGIDGVNGHNGMPCCIIIPILMHYNHFGILAVKPSADRSKSEVYYFNPLGTLENYKDEEEPIFQYFENRYGINRSSIVHNNTEAWQTDTSQCGPYIIWFAKTIASLICYKQFDKAHVNDILSAIFNMGANNDENTVVRVRAEHAGWLEKYSTNFSTLLFLKFRSYIEENTNWHENYKNLKFDNTILQDEWGQTKKCKDMEGYDVDRIDTFELQPATQEAAVELYSNLKVRQELKAQQDLDNELMRMKEENNKELEKLMGLRRFELICGAGLLLLPPILAGLSFLPSLITTYLPVPEPARKPVIIGCALGAAALALIAYNSNNKSSKNELI